MLIMGCQKRDKTTESNLSFYETTDEAKTYQAQYGGTINIIRKYREELQYEHNDLDNMSLFSY